MFLIYTVLSHLKRNVLFIEGGMLPGLIAYVKDPTARAVHGDGIQNCQHAKICRITGVHHGNLQQVDDTNSLYLLKG